MKNQAVYRNDYPLINRKKALSSKAATVEALIISKANSDNGEIVISREELAGYGVCELKSKNIVRELELVADELLCYKVLLPEKEGWKARWRTLATKFDVSNSDAVHIEIHEDLTPYLIDLRECFTAVEVAEVASLSSKFSKRLYMLLKTLEPKKSSKGYVYNADGGGRFTLQQIKDCLGIANEKTYKQFKFLNGQVLKPAIKDLNKLSDITVSMSPERSGRSVIAVDFKVQRRVNHQRKFPSFNMPEPVEKNKLSSVVLNFAKKHNFNNVDFLHSIIAEFGEKEIKKSFTIFESKYLSPNVKNPAGVYYSKFTTIMDTVFQQNELSEKMKAEKASKQDIKEEIEAREKDRNIILSLHAKGNEKRLYDNQPASFQEMISFEDCTSQMFLDMANEDLKGI